MQLGVFTRDLVGGDRQVRRLAQVADDVEVGAGGLHHQEVGAFFGVENRLTGGLAAIGGIHLVGGLRDRGFAGLAGAADGVAERTVERRGELGGVGEDARTGMSCCIESLADRLHASVHHVGGRDEIRAGLGGQDRHFHERFDGAVIVHVRAGGVQHAVVAVRGVGVEGDVGEDHRAGRLRLHFADGAVGEVRRVEGFGAFGGLAGRVDLGEEGHAMDAEGEQFRALGAELGERDAADAGKGADGFGHVAFGDEERLDQVAGFDDRFAEHGADTGRGPEAAEADGLVEGGRHRRFEIAVRAGQGNGEASRTPRGETLCHSDPPAPATGNLYTLENPSKSGNFPWHKPCQ